MAPRFKRLLVAFWAVFFTVTAVSNLVDLLGALGALDWRFLRSGNYDYLRSVVGVYGVGPALTKLLLGGALVLEGVAAWLFWRALRRPDRALAAVTFGSGVWMAFVLMCELFTAYESESVFRELLALMIVTALALALIPTNPGAKPGVLPLTGEPQPLEHAAHAK